MVADIIETSIIFLEAAIIWVPIGMALMSPYFRAVLLRLAGQRKAVLKLSGPQPDASFIIVNEVMGNEAIRFQFKKVGKLVNYNPKMVKRVMGVPEYCVDVRDWRMIPQESPFAPGSYLDDKGKPVMVVLEEWLNKLVPPEDADGAYMTYQATARSEIEEKAKASNTNTILLIMLGIVIILGILSVITANNAATGIDSLKQICSAIKTNSVVNITASG